MVSHLYTLANCSQLRTADESVDTQLMDTEDDGDVVVIRNNISGTSGTSGQRLNNAQEVSVIPLIGVLV